jgi:hypothetical protein
MIDKVAKRAKLRAQRAAGRIAHAKHLLAIESGWSAKASIRKRDTAAASAKRTRRLNKLQKLSEGKLV